MGATEAIILLRTRLQDKIGMKIIHPRHEPFIKIAAHSSNIHKGLCTYFSPLYILYPTNVTHVRCGGKQMKVNEKHF